MTEVTIDKGAKGAQQLGILLSVLVPNVELQVRVRDLDRSWHVVVEGSTQKLYEEEPV